MNAGRYSPSGLLGRFWTVLATPIMRLDAAVVRRDFPVLERPVDARARERARAKVDVAHARRGAPPEVRLAADGEAARPHPLRAGRRRERNLVLPHAFDVFVVHVTVGLGALRRIAEAAKLHVPGLAVMAEILDADPAGVPR